MSLFQITWRPQHRYSRSLSWVPAPRPFGKLRACFHGDRGMLRGKAKSVRFCDILCAS